ncbi:chalcone isomerase family protein [Dokdonia sp. Hel_I_53]|uniref:chalcone isomerase family protein n=1 Tax=Dokdonia sp. Hel_I_53 TaxID=1566287 RepID=UPI001198DA60|nr:chalcone isomerase family protein [Dokdonia sp. Hel_I_53]TVZ51505.1 chalcone isomerase-like protein [Dokdonia sp. Hel_I_53]
MKKYFIALLAICSLTFSNAQTVVGDATLPNTMKVEGTNLILNGAGMREKIIFDLYAGGLYLTKKNKNATAIINADETMAMKLEIISGMVSSKKMVSAVDDGFDASMNGNTKSLNSEIEKFKSFFSDKIVKTNVFDIVYIKGKGTYVYKGGNKIGMIEGLAFKKALFGIWLGNDPADDDLKEGMLGL